MVESKLTVALPSPVGRDFIKAFAPWALSATEGSLRAEWYSSNLIFPTKGLVHTQCVSKFTDATEYYNFSPLIATVLPKHTKKE